MSQLSAAALVIASLLAAIAGASTAQVSEPAIPAPREALEWMVLDEINSAYFNRGDPMNRPGLINRVPDGVIREVDFSHDGVSDWLVDYTDSGLMYCGTGGCQRSLYVSVPNGGYVLAFNSQSYDFVIGSRDGETVLDLAVHQVMCWPANDDCAYSFAWDPSLQRLVERPNVRGETMLSSEFSILAPEQDEPGPPEGSPIELQTKWRETVKVCASYAREGEFDVIHAKIYSVPDLDGDGVRDWFYQAPAICAGEAGTTGDQNPFEIYLARTNGRAELVFTSAPGERPVYDIATNPAVLISNPECGFDVTCRDTRLQWDARTARFMPTGRGDKDG